MSDPTADEIDEIAEILADPERDTDMYPGLGAERWRSGRLRRERPTCDLCVSDLCVASPRQRDGSLDGQNADNTDAQPAKVRALASEPAAPALPPSLTEEQGPFSPHT